GSGDVGEGGAASEACSHHRAAGVDGPVEAGLAVVERVCSRTGGQRRSVRRKFPNPHLTPPGQEAREDSRGYGNATRPAAPGSSPGHDPRGIGMSFVTPAHVRQLAEAEFSDLPVLAIDTDGEIEVFPQSTAQARGAEILTDAAALLDYTNGEGLDDTL